MRYTEKDDIGWAIHGDAVYSDCGAPEGFRGGGIEAFAALEDILYAPDGSERITLDRLAELVTAEVEGRVVVLPCQVGTTIYTTRWWDNVEEKCTDSHGKPFYRTRMKHKITKESYHPFGLDFSEWGKTVFLTRTEAEQAKGE